MEESQRKVLNVSTRRKVLEELVKSDEATAYGISRELGIPDAAVGRHLEILQEVDLVGPPEIDTSSGRLKKIYRPASNAKEVLEEFWEEEIQSAPKKIKERYLGGDRNG